MQKSYKVATSPTEWILGRARRISPSKIWKFLDVTVTWSNEQMVTLLEVMITSQVTITSQEVIVTSPINEQMVEASKSGEKCN